MPPRTVTDRFFLVRLLADLPRERLRELGAAWGVQDPGDRGWIAALYRQMTDVSVGQEVIARLGDDVRLVFRQLARAGRPIAQSELLRALPFSEERIEESLRILETEGLAWKLHSGARDRQPSDREWLVPVELRDAPRPRRPATRRGVLSGASNALPGAPELRVVDKPPPIIRPVARLPALVTNLDRIGEGGSGETGLPGADLLQFARHCGEALGVWITNGPSIRAGPRLAAWRQLTSAQRVRALARLWLVDDRSPRHVPVLLRQALWQVLMLADVGTWYDVSSLARRVAWQMTFVGSGRADSAGQGHAPDRRAVMTRRDLDAAVEVLGWVGVILVGDVSPRRPVAIQITGDGRRALEDRVGEGA